MMGIKSFWIVVCIRGEMKSLKILTQNGYLTLQLLIENCVKHNEISSNRQLTIKVIREQDNVRVWNNRQPKDFMGGIYEDKDAQCQ